MDAGPIGLENRLSIRTRPAGFAVMRQHWGKLLFMHWAMPPACLRPLVPPQLTIDTHDGAAWVGVVPFTMWGVRAACAPPLPGLSAMHELNVRTYVHYRGVPGVWFMSMDASNAFAVWGARKFFFLPYYTAEMSLAVRERQTIEYASRRTHAGAPHAEFQAAYTYGEAMSHAEPESLDFFLTERYCLYAERAGEIYRGRIHHQKWPLRRADATVRKSSVLEALGLPAPVTAPLLHYANRIAVDIWPLVKV